MKPEQKPVVEVSVIITKRLGKVLEVPLSKELVRAAVEILVAEGQSPSAQRNQAARAAQGQVIYFLDSDSAPGPGLIKRARELFSDPLLDVAGGPDLAKPGEGAIAGALDWVQGSLLGSGPVRARYRPLTRQVPASEKTLILCNLGFRKETFLRYGGFNEGLYPNEENELLSRMAGDRCKMISDPGLVIYKPRPGTLAGVVHQALRYGRGRSEQFRVLPRASDLVHFSAIGLGGLWLVLAFWNVQAALAVALVVLLLAGGEGLRALSRGSGWKIAAWVPLILLMRHLCYGLGTLGGMFTRPKKVEAVVSIERFLDGKKAF